MKEVQPDLHVVITAHDSDINTHKTILNILSQKRSDGYNLLLYLFLSHPTKPTIQYVSENQSFLLQHGISIVYNYPSLNGYIFNITAGNLISPDFLSTALSTLSQQPNSIVRPSHTLLFFCNTPSKPLIYNNHNTRTESLEAVLFYKDTFYDLTKDIQITTIPETFLFKRTLYPIGKFDTQKLSIPIEQSIRWSPSSLKQSHDPQAHYSKSTLKSTKKTIAKIIDRNPLVTKVVRSTLHNVRIVKNTLSKTFIPSKRGLPPKLITAANQINTIEPLVFLDKKTHYYNEISKEVNNKINTSIDYYIKSCQHLRHNHYDYVIFTPWLIAGGADMFVINYANYVANIHPDYNILIISTDPNRKSLDRHLLNLNDKIDFLPLSEITDSHNREIHIMNSIVSIMNNVSPSIIHIVLSSAGYKYIEQHSDYLRTRGTKVILTGYNSVKLSTGQCVGYAVDTIPNLYQKADLFTTDNQTTKSLWVNDFGFSIKKVHVHNQPFDAPPPIHKKTHPGINILWAAHIRKEKNPEVVVKIAKKILASHPDINIDCYGALDVHNYTKNPFTTNTPPNLHYKGAFQDFYRDINLGDYDLFLYTSLADGTPNVLIQAGLTKLPIITSSIGGIPDLIQDDGTLINEPLDTQNFISAIEDFVKDKSPYIRKANQFQEKLLQNHSKENFKQQIEDMLHSVGH